MPELWLLGGAVLLGVVIGLCLHLTFGRREGSVGFANARERRLTLRLAAELGCSLEDVVDYVRRELELAPSLPDDTILKRAAYHYRRNLPEPGMGRAYRDRSPG
jgi:hypothetical protein